MSSNNGGFSYIENPVIMLAKEVMGLLDEREHFINEGITAFEEALEYGENEQDAAQDLIMTVATADKIYNSAISKLSCKYVQVLGKGSLKEQLLGYMLGESSGSG